MSHNMAATWYVNASVSDPSTLINFLLAKFQEWGFIPACVWSYPGDSSCASAARMLSERTGVAVQEVDSLKEFEIIPNEEVLWQWIEYYNGSLQGVLFLTAQAFQAVVRGYKWKWQVSEPETFAISQYPDDWYCVKLSELQQSSAMSVEPPAPQPLPNPWQPNPDPHIDRGRNFSSQPYQPPPESQSTVHAKLNIPAIIQDVKTQSQPTVSQSVKQLETRLQSNMDRAKTALLGKLDTLSQRVTQTLANCTLACKQTLSSSFIQTDSATLEQIKQFPTTVLSDDMARLQACQKKLIEAQEKEEKKRKEYEDARAVQVQRQPLRILDTKTEEGSIVLQLLVANFEQGTLKVIVDVQLHGSARQTFQQEVNIPSGITYVPVEDDQFFRDCTSADFSMWLLGYQASNLWTVPFKEPEPVQYPVASYPSIPGAYN